MALTNKQKAFIIEYVKDFNATQAAIRAGYSENTAAEIGYENLTKSYIAKAINDHLKTLSTETKQLFKKFHKSSRATDYLYIIEAVSLGLYKIGISNNPHTRVATLNNASPVELKLIGHKRDLFASNLEKQLHTLFEDKRVRGEWFALTLEDLKIITQEYGIAYI